PVDEDDARAAVGDPAFLRRVDRGGRRAGLETAALQAAQIRVLPRLLTLSGKALLDELLERRAAQARERVRLRPARFERRPIALQRRDFRCDCAHAAVASCFTQS